MLSDSISPGRRQPTRAGKLLIFSLSTVACMVGQLPSTADAQRVGNDMSVAVHAGTLGVGVQVSKLVASRVGLRAGGSFVEAYFNQTLGDLDYASKLNFRNFAGLADLYVRSRGSFRITGGIVQRSDKILAIASPNETGAYILNETEYSLREVGELTGKIEFPAVAPYAGIGWGSPKSQGWRLRPVFDLGVVVGAPRFVLNTQSGTGNAELMSDLRIEEQTRQEDLNSYMRIWPVISLALAYHF